MKIMDPGHIYKVSRGEGFWTQIITFVKRGGGAVTYQKEWPGAQTQAVMRAVITHLISFIEGRGLSVEYKLWQLGSDKPQPLILGGALQVNEIIEVLKDRSVYLNGIISCAETRDAIQYLQMAQNNIQLAFHTNGASYRDAVLNMRMALWSYEARAYRRKQESLNRQKPEHDDSQRLKAWRAKPAEDVPFSYQFIEERPIGPDGHVFC